MSYSFKAVEVVTLWKNCSLVTSLIQVPQYNHFFISLPACLLQRKTVDYTRVQEYSLRVLKWRPGNAKALYRAGVATLEMGDAETAKEYLIQASKEQPNGKDPDHHDLSEQVDVIVI